MVQNNYSDIASLLMKAEKAVLIILIAAHYSPL